MQSIHTLIVTGYRSFELGVFQENDPKVKVIKKVIKNTLEQYLEEGLNWVLLGGNLGIELWCGQVIEELKVDYPELKFSVIFPYLEFGNHWNETNQAALQKVVEEADYVDSVSHLPYKNPSQLKNHTHFLLTHADGAIVVYDDEYAGKTSYFLHDANEYASEHAFLIHQITMDDLQDAVFDDSV
ncbi:UPF0398 protein [Alicyclobacillus contaminans]|uniref:UPF0398 protein GCM10025885_07610 n=1 Tax=Tetragenococcus osmophilus TaxID=526944 RepID=A0AA38CYQ2_9ENTE|nr:DUF1273 domain-containing protein [Tetragenococcus osmophilus]GMA54433.1 UPF0398 protein [Alicyclobacillus contaminans]GMA71712.1 UPF0398 protein [Tetragenococcus osmophilus]